MTMTLLELKPAPTLEQVTGGGEFEPVHLVCCDDYVALCGEPVLHDDWVDEDAPWDDTCAMCVCVSDTHRPCTVPTCIGGTRHRCHQGMCSTCG